MEDTEQGAAAASRCDPLVVLPVELCLRILDLVLTTSTDPPHPSSGAGLWWLHHEPFAPAQFLQSLHLVSVWWRTVVTTHGHALWRLVGTQLRDALPRALRNAPVLDKLRHVIFVPPIVTTGGGLLASIRRVSTPVVGSPVPQPKSPARETAELEWDWEDRVRACLKALYRRQHGICWVPASAKPTEVRGTVTDLWGDLAVSFNLRSIGVHDTVSGRLMRVFEIRGRMSIVFAVLRPAASGDQVLAVVDSNGELSLRVFDLVSARGLVTAILNTTVLLARAPQKRGFLSASTRWLGVCTDQYTALWDLSAVDAALSSAEANAPVIKLALDSVVMVEARFCAAHPTRDAIALARPPSGHYTTGGTPTTAQSPTPDECLLVTVYDIVASIDASASCGEAAAARLGMVATAEVPQRTLTSVAFNSRLMAVVGGQQPEVLLFAFTPCRGNDPQQPPLELTRLRRPLRVEAARYSMTQPCVALDDRRLYYYYDCSTVAIFDAQELLLESPGQTCDEAQDGDEVVEQDWSHRALVAQLHAGPVADVGARSGGSAGEAYAQDRSGAVSVVAAEAVKLLVDPCSSIGVQAGDSEDLHLFPF